MGDTRLQELARAFAESKLADDAYRSKRAELLDSLVAEAAGEQRTPREGFGTRPEQHPAQPPWMSWLPLAVVGLALASTLIWISA